jgi:hypothetical protein
MADNDDAAAALPQLAERPAGDIEPAIAQANDVDADEDVDALFDGSDASDEDDGADDDEDEAPAKAKVQRLLLPSFCVSIYRIAWCLLSRPVVVDSEEFA